ncbi:MAG: septal ring lytic transglycosylase RlpA family protein [SAR324 cluster bacterium]|nr:septal ring lytic transglycosylase RlpA family protein [SAR324 cluster bacterium]
MNGFNLLRFACGLTRTWLPLLLLIGGCSVSRPDAQAPPSAPSGESDPIMLARPLAEERQDPSLPPPSPVAPAPAPMVHRESARSTARYALPLPAALIPLHQPGFSRTKRNVPSHPAARPSRSQGKAAGRTDLRPVGRPASVPPLRQLPPEDIAALAPYLRGWASWYGPAFHGKKTASGEVYNQYGLSAAHPVLPMGTRILVENLENGKRVQLRVNDRGPFVKGRVVDITRSAAVRLGMVKKGTAPVRISVVRWPFGMDPAQGLKAYRQYIVQVAAYPDPRKAESQRRHLDSRFGEFPFRVQRAPKGLFAIYTGPFENESAARQVASVLRKSGIPGLVRAYRK